MNLTTLPLNLNRLRLFLAVVEYEGVTRAAEAISVSQPAISQAIHALEQELDTSLLEHVGRTVTPTEAGVLLASYGRRIFNLTEESREALDDLAGLQRGRLAIGASTTIGIYVLPRLLATYQRRYPGITLALDVGNTGQVIQDLVDGRCDLALVEGPVSDPRVESTPWLDDELVLIVPVGHPLASAGPATAKALADAPFLAREPGSGTRDVVSEALDAWGVVPRVYMELGHTEAIKQAVVAGIGVSILSRLTVERELAAGLLVSPPMTPGRITRTLWIVMRSEYRPSSAARAMLALLDSVKSATRKERDDDA
jgi:DNA-binding transcriptional LysR family regulator